MPMKISASTNPPPVEKLPDYIKELEELDIDYIHCDVMDGKFVPAYTFGCKETAEIKKITKLPLDVHLMIVKPEKLIKKFIKAGADILTVHYEAFVEGASADICFDTNAVDSVNILLNGGADKTVKSGTEIAENSAKNAAAVKNGKDKLIKTLLKIAKLGALPSVSIKPNTPAEVIFDVIPYCGMVLVMSVEPGKSGQEFLPGSIKKIKELKQFLTDQGYTDVLIEVDGGINAKDIKELAAAGADIAVVGSALYKSDNRKKTVKQLKI